MGEATSDRGAPAGDERSARPPAERIVDGERSARQPAIRVIMMPKDTNALGTIFGGIILSYIDQAGAVEGHRHVRGKLVTVAMREVVFLAPVLVGDMVSFWADTVRVGRTSVTVKVSVEAERRLGSSPGRYAVTEAEVVYVHVDESGHPTPITGPAGS